MNVINVGMSKWCGFNIVEANACNHYIDMTCYDTILLHTSVGIKMT